MIKFDKDIPIPQQKNSWKQYAVFQGMSVNDSFFIAHSQPAEAQHGIRSMFCNLYQDTGIKISIRRRTENGVKGVRVWRIQ